MESHGTSDTFFFQTLKRAHFLKSGRKKMVHIFVYQWEVQGDLCAAPETETGWLHPAQPLVGPASGAGGKLARVA